MNLVLKSCKSDATSMTLTAVDSETGREMSAFIPVRTCGGPFLQHDASVGSLVADLFTAINVAAVAPAEVEEVAVVEAPKKLGSLRPSKLPPKDVA